jgi:hypothetical protein
MAGLDNLMALVRCSRGQQIKERARVKDNLKPVHSLVQLCPCRIETPRPVGDFHLSVNKNRRLSCDPSICLHLPRNQDLRRTPEPKVKYYKSLQVGIFSLSHLRLPRTDLSRHHRKIPFCLPLSWLNLSRRIQMVLLSTDLREQSRGVRYWLLRL